MRTNLRHFCTFLAAIAACGCGAEAGSVDSEEAFGSTQEAFTVTGTSLSALGPHTVGTAVNVNAQYFQWTDFVSTAAGQYLACHGNFFVNPCGSADTVRINYTSPFPATHIKAMGVSQKDGKVYTWYDTNTAGGASATGTWSRGDSLNLAPLGVGTFSPPAGLTISQLIEADMSSSGTWQFFWQTPQGVRRSLSTKPESGGTLTAGFVQVLPNLTIAGIAISKDNPNGVFTWYTNADGTSGPINISTNAQDLAH